MTWFDWLYLASNLMLVGGFWTMAALLLILTHRSGTALYRRRKARPVVWSFAAFIAATGFIFLLRAISFWWTSYWLMLALTIATAGLVWLSQVLLIPMIRTVRDVTPEEEIESLTQRINDLIEKLTPFADAIRSVDDGER